MRIAVSTKRLSLTRHGKVCYELKIPYNDGATQVLFEPLDETQDQTVESMALVEAAT